MSENQNAPACCRDRLAHDLHTTVEMIAHGNNAKADDVQVVSVQRRDYTAFLAVWIRFDWRYDDVQTLTGRRKLEHRECCASKADANEKIQTHFNEETANPEFGNKSLDFAKYELSKLLEYENKVFVYKKPSRETYWHETCQTCDGDRILPCSNRSCRNGDIACPDFACTFGRKSCRKCDGTGWITVYFRDNQKELVPCNVYECNFGQVVCKKCNGTSYVTCPTCRGRTVLNCSTCDATGVITYVPEVEYTADVRTRLLWDKDEEPQNKSLYSGMAPTRIFEKLVLSRFLEGSYDPQEAETFVFFGGPVPEVQVLMRCKGIDITARAVGRNNALSYISPFLNKLLEPLVARIKAASGAEAFKIAYESSLFSSVANQVIKSNNRNFDVFVDFMERTASRDLLKQVAKHLDGCYETLGRKESRKVWQTGSVVIGLSGFIGWFYDPAALVGLTDVTRAVNFRFVVDVSVPVAVTTLVAIIAGSHRRKRALADLGCSESRLPKSAGAYFGRFGLPAMAVALAITWLGVGGIYADDRPIAERPTAVIPEGARNISTRIAQITDAAWTKMVSLRE